MTKQNTIDQFNAILKYLKGTDYIQSFELVLKQYHNESYELTGNVQGNNCHLSVTYPIEEYTYTLAQDHCDIKVLEKMQNLLLSKSFEDWTREDFAEVGLDFDAFQLSGSFEHEGPYAEFTWGPEVEDVEIYKLYRLEDIFYDYHVKEQEQIKRESWYSEERETQGEDPTLIESEYELLHHPDIVWNSDEKQSDDVKEYPLNLELSYIQINELKFEF